MVNDLKDFWYEEKMFVASPDIHLEDDILEDEQDRIKRKLELFFLGEVARLVKEKEQLSERYILNQNENDLFLVGKIEGKLELLKELAGVEQNGK